jgi:hypothetical protein
MWRVKCVSFRPADAGELTCAIDRALELGVVDTDAVRLILEHRRDQAVGLFGLGWSCRR